MSYKFNDIVLVKLKHVDKPIKARILNSSKSYHGIIIYRVEILRTRSIEWLEKQYVYPNGKLSEAIYL